MIVSRENVLEEPSLHLLRLNVFDDLCLNWDMPPEFPALGVRPFEPDDLVALRLRRQVLEPRPLCRFRCKWHELPFRCTTMGRRRALKVQAKDVGFRESRYLAAPLLLQLVSNQHSKAPELPLRHLQGRRQQAVLL